MNKIFLLALPLLMSSVCYAEDITIRYNGTSAKVEQSLKDSVKVTVKGADVNIESLYQDHKLTLLLKGKSDNGQLTLKTAGKAKVTLQGLNLTSQEGAPLDLKNKKKVEVVAAKGTENTLSITACNDTVNHKAAVIWAKDKLLLSGKGTLNIIATGDGCRGIKTKKDITIEDLTLNVTSVALVMTVRCLEVSLVVCLTLVVASLVSAMTAPCLEASLVVCLTLAVECLTLAVECLILETEKRMEKTTKTAKVVAWALAVSTNILLLPKASPRRVRLPSIAAMSPYVPLPLVPRVSRVKTVLCSMVAMLM